jgi:hypothetical protein
MKKYYSFLVVLSTLNIIARNQPSTLIITSAYNQPEFLEFQYRTFKKFLKEDFKFVVVDDSIEQHNTDAIKNICVTFSLEYIRFPQDMHCRYLPYPSCPTAIASVRHAEVMQYGIDKCVLTHEGPVLIIDSDMFLIENFSVTDFLHGYHIASYVRSAMELPSGLVPHKDKKFLWLGLVMFDTRTLPALSTFNTGIASLPGLWTDSGGNTYHYLKNNPDLKLRMIDLTNTHIETVPQPVLINFPGNNITHSQIMNTQFLRDQGIKELTINLLQSLNSGVQFLHGTTFLHYRAGSNWDGQSDQFHIAKKLGLREYIDKLVE